MTDSQQCRICEQGCRIPPGGTGICRMYTQEDGTIRERYPDSYLTIMPVSIETVPILHHSPRAKVLQVSSTGCTFSCPGCVSGVLIGDIERIAVALKRLPPEAVVARANQEGCSGIVFCLNEPAVSLPSFLRLARAASDAGLSVGCSTNGYFTKEALDQLIPYLDFINFGLKGSSDQPYHMCGAAHAAPVYRNIAACVRNGVHVEASVMYLKGSEEEVAGAARHLSKISPEIPLQVMRFVPFGDADLRQEPTILESESLCDRLKQTLPYIYLFNSPGTRCLNTVCPSCGGIVFTREFYGPMGARTVQALPEARCTCGFTIPVKGAISATGFEEPGMLGGYRVTRALEMVEAILVCLGAGGKAAPPAFWPSVVSGEFIKDLHDRIQTIDGYFGLVRDIGARCGKMPEAEGLVGYLSERVDLVRSRTSGAPKPRVYYSMGTPLFALNAGRFEIALVETAGGEAVNRTISRKGKPGVNISKEEFNAFSPSVIFISGFLSAPAEDYLRTCRSQGLSARAVDKGAVYTMPPGWDFGSPRWVLGLMKIANLLHPDRCSFDLDYERTEFYRRFYGSDAGSADQNRSFSNPPRPATVTKDTISGPQGRQNIPLR
ncbi:MAG: radical SAM protein [Methanomicrobiales archaeon]|nr:radical SAM protein [Methanomicrobiales archaeon]